MKTRNTKTAAEIKEVRDFLRDRAIESSIETGKWRRYNRVDYIWDVMMSIESYESCDLSAEDVISLLKERLTFDADFCYNLEREDIKNG